MRRLVVLLLAVLLPHETSCSSAAASDGGGQCSRRCGGTTVPYPFGFSRGCLIALSCDASTSTAILPYRGDNGTTYRVTAFNSSASTIVVSVPPSCSRSVADAKKALSGANYGVSFHTGLFLRGGCREINASAGPGCSVPASVMSRLLRTAQCRDNDTTVTCFASSPMNATVAPAPSSAYTDQFLRWEKVEAFRCGDALTAALYGGMDTVLSLEFNVAELGWWLNGTCTGSGEPCAANATCTDVKTPSGAAGYRCACVAGMDGDGFSAGDGCYLDSESADDPVDDCYTIEDLFCLHSNQMVEPRRQMPLPTTTSTMEASTTS